MKLRQRIITAAALLILAVMFAFEITSSRQESQTIDEAVHLAAGYSYWKTGDFRMNPEHPPLIKMLAAFPLLFTKATLPTHDPSWQKVDEWKFGEVFLYHNTLSPDTLLLLGRLPIMLLSLVLGWAIFRASGAMFGTVAGFLSLGLYAFDPNVIAHSRYVTTDLGFTALMFFSLLALQKLLAQPNRKHAVWFGLALFVTSLSKFSFPVLVVALLVLLAVLKALQPHHPALQWSRWGQGLLVAIPIALVATWAVYGFELRRPVDDPRVMYLYQQRQDLLGSKLLAEQSPWKRYVVTTLGDQTKGIGKTAAHLLTLRYPLYSFFRGSISVLGHSEIGQSSFVLGQFGNQGWWYYFPVAFFTKTPPLTLLMFLGSAVGFVMLLIKTRHERKSWLDGFRSLDRRWYLLGIPAVVYFGFSLFSHLDLGWRYLMPIYPPLFVMSGSVVMVP
ncbi:MAG: glycosyltransferase family 39 protein, partial [Candidatus Vogelbacteria bacterium]|nr:glycosyltransferase family 39 protein [Candidatus Vogelbacteria bacterium]